MWLDSLMTALCDQVRRLTGASGKLGISKMTNELSKINLGVDVSGADAAAGDVLSGKKFVGSNGVVEEGGMTNNGAVSQTLTATKKSYTIPPGYHNGNGKVKINTQTKSVTPSSSVQTVNPDSGYLLSSVTVRAAASSSGKAGYRGTLTTNGTYNLSINVGVALSSSDHFMLCSSGDAPMAEIVNFAYKSGDESYVYACSSIGDDEYGYNGYVGVHPNGISYSGSTVTISNAGRCYGSYVWSIIKA